MMEQADRPILNISCGAGTDIERHCGQFNHATLGTSYVPSVRSIRHCRLSFSSQFGIQNASHNREIPLAYIVDHYLVPSSTLNLRPTSTEMTLGSSAEATTKHSKRCSVSRVLFVRCESFAFSSSAIPAAIQCVTMRLPQPP